MDTVTNREKKEQKAQPCLSPIEDVIKDFAAGKMVILLDDVDRENEGDLTVATEKLTAAQITFMMQQARGQICVSIPLAIAEKLELPLQVINNASQFQTPFAISVDAKSVKQNGATAKGRLKTMRQLINPIATSSDFVSGGHVYPLIVHPNGVLGRHGQTEGSHDLAVISGLFPSGVICEILNQDGTMAKGEQLAEYAKKHKLKMTSVEELAKYRIANETIVHNIANRKISTKQGEFYALTFIDDVDHVEHIVLTKGDITRADNITLAVFKEDLVKDIFSGFGSDIPETMKLISNSNAGVLIYLTSTQETKEFSFKEIEIVKKILHFLEVKKIKLLTESENLLKELGQINLL